MCCHIFSGRQRPSNTLSAKKNNKTSFLYLLLEVVLKILIISEENIVGFFPLLVQTSLLTSKTPSCSIMINQEIQILYKFRGKDSYLLFLVVPDQQQLEL